MVVGLIPISVRQGTVLIILSFLSKTDLKLSNRLATTKYFDTLRIILEKKVIEFLIILNLIVILSLYNSYKYLRVK